MNLQDDKADKSITIGNTGQAQQWGLMQRNTYRSGAATPARRLFDVMGSTYEIKLQFLRFCCERWWEMAGKRAERPKIEGAGNES